MREMLTSTGFKLVEQIIEEAHGDAVTRLLFGHAGQEGRLLEQAEYARLLGFLSGLRQFRWAAEAFTEHAERVRSKESSMSETEDYGAVEDSVRGLRRPGLRRGRHDESESSDGLDRIYDRMEEMAANQQALAEAINQNYYDDDEDQDDDEEPVEFEDENGQLTEEGARALIADMVAEQVADQLSPREHAAQVAERDEDFDDLRDEIPELQDDRIAGAVLSRALDWANNVDPASSTVPSSWTSSRPPTRPCATTRDPGSRPSEKSCSAPRRAQHRRAAMTTTGKTDRRRR